MSEEIAIEGATRLGEGETIAFSFERGGYPERGFVIQYRGTLRAYVNRCPHWNVDLDLGDERFYDAEVERIYCKTHGALFRPESGLCDAGPCFGDTLESLPLRTEGDDAFVTVQSVVRILY